METRRLCVAHVNAESGFSGGEVQVFLLMEGLRERGYRNVLFCPPRSASAAEAARRGLEYREVSMRNEADVAAVMALRRGLHACSADVAHLHTGRAAWLGGIAARLAGVPALITRRMDRRVKRGWRTQLLYKRLTRHVVAISAAVARCLVEGGVPAAHMHLIHSAVAPAALVPAVEPAVTRATLGASPTTVVVLALAALIPRKGIDVLLDALASITGNGASPLVWIAGDGPDRDLLQQRAQRAGLGEHVRFLGARRDVADLLAACDIVVMPSRREGLGVAALEAMATGRPVLASAVGGLSEVVVNERTGLLVPPDDAAALAAALMRLIRDPQLRARLGAAGPERIAEGFSAAQMVAAYDRLYGTVIDEWRTTRQRSTDRA